jgi:hypothetical protein
MALATCVGTAFEQRRPLPVDDLVPDALFTSTHAITIDAPPEQVWPWIAQMGAGRAGWYSWDLIDNGGTPSARRVLPEFQTVVPGDVMPAVPGATDAFVVSAVEPPRDLVLTVPDGHGHHAVAWEHVLVPLEGGRTRLLVRGRASVRWLDLARAQPPAGHRRIFIERLYAVLARLPRPLLIASAALGHRMMEARHVRGIRRRSTAAARRLERPEFMQMSHVFVWPFKTSPPARSAGKQDSDLAGRSHRCTCSPGLRRSLAGTGASVDWWREAWLACGILAAVLYIAMTLFVGVLWEGYRVADQTISELSAIGAPTRPLWMVLGTIYGVLMIAFGWGVWRSSGRNRALRVVGALLITQAVFGLFWPPMHRRAVLAAGGGTLTDTLHIVWTIVTSVFFMFALGFGAAAFGKRFRLYSLATMGIVFGAGAWTGTFASAIQANLPTPWAGLWERVNTTAFMLWVAVLATALLRGSNQREANHASRFRVQDT